MVFFCNPSEQTTHSNNDNNNSSNNNVEKARAFLKKQENVVVDLKLHETRPVAGKAFGGLTGDKCEPMMAYGLKASMGETILNDDSDGDSDSTKNRQELAAMCLGFFIHETTVQKGGLAFGIQEESSDDSDSNRDNNNNNKGDGSTIKAVVIFREYDPSKENKTPSFLDQIRSTVGGIWAFYSMKSDQLGFPEILQNDSNKLKQFRKSGEAMEPAFAQLHHLHHEYGPPEKHWYVAVVATDPVSQGKGYGKRVINLLGQVADLTGMPCYLECPEYDRTFYEKCGGYKALKLVTIPFTDPTNTTEDLSIPFYLMARDPVKK